MTWVLPRHHGSLLFKPNSTLIIYSIILKLSVFIESCWPKLLWVLYFFTNDNNNSCISIRFFFNYSYYLIHILLKKIKRDMLSFVLLIMYDILLRFIILHFSLFCNYLDEKFDNYNRELLILNLLSQLHCSACSYNKIYNYYHSLFDNKLIHI